VRERVLHDREVEAPEEDGDEEEDVGREAVAHGGEGYATPRGPKGQLTSAAARRILGDGRARPAE
jgi:hypothetical protein